MNVNTVLLSLILCTFCLPVSWAQRVSSLIPSKIYSGPQPNEEIWAELGKLKIKVIVSVDGLKPDLLAAKQRNIRYIHLPIGYAGVSDQRRLELAAVVKQINGPIYVHCHHGQHRGPVAAVIAARGNGLISETKALKFLNQKKTSPNYEGLWKAVRSAAPLSKVSPIEFHEYLPPDKLTTTMAEVDRVWDHIKKFEKKGLFPVT